MVKKTEKTFDFKELNETVDLQVRIFGSLSKTVSGSIENAVNYYLFHRNIPVVNIGFVQKHNGKFFKVEVNKADYEENKEKFIEFTKELFAEISKRSEKEVFDAEKIEIDLPSIPKYFGAILKNEETRRRMIKAK